jgi:flagellar hook-length control protein FliK
MVQQMASQTSAVVASPSASTAVAAPGDTLREAVGTAAWSHEVGQATLRMAANDMQNVSLRLNPEHLGPMDVQMRVDDGVAHLQFTAAHLDTRQALEASRTTLHQMFSDQGIKLGDWSVGQQSANASSARDFGSARSQSGNSGGPPTDDADSQGTTVATTIRTTQALGLVDTFA